VAVEALARPRARPRDTTAALPVRTGLVIGLGLLAVLPLVLTAARLGDPFTHVADVALLDLQARRLPGDVPLLGPYSRFGWRHPGPLAAYVAGLAQVLTGGSTRAVFLAALATNVTSVTAIGVILRRAVGASGALAGVAVLLGWAVVVEPEHVLSPWGPHAVALPLALVLVALAGMLAGVRWCVVPVVLAASFVVQTHVGLAPAVAALGVTTAVALLVCRLGRRRGAHFARPLGRRARWAPLLVAGALALGVWAPTLIEQADGDPGNLTRLWRFATDPPSDRTVGHPWDDAVDAVVRGMAQPLPWPDARWVLPAVVGLGAGFVLVALLPARRRRAGGGFALGLAALGGIALVVAALSATQVVGELYGYLFFWTSAAAAVVLLAGVVATVVRWPVPTWVPVVAIAALGAVLVRQFATDDGASYRSADGVDALADHADNVLDRQGARSVLVDIVGPEAWPKAVGIVLELDRRGYDVRLERGAAEIFDPDLAPDGRQDACLLVDHVDRGTRPLDQTGRAEVVTVKRTAVAVLDRRRCPEPDQPLVLAATETPTPPSVSAP